MIRAAHTHTHSHTHRYRYRYPHTSIASMSFLCICYSWGTLSNSSCAEGDFENPWIKGTTVMKQAGLKKKKYCISP